MWRGKLEAEVVYDNWYGLNVYVIQLHQYTAVQWHIQLSILSMCDDHSTDKMLSDVNEYLRTLYT